MMNGRNLRVLLVCCVLVATYSGVAEAGSKFKDVEYHDLVAQLDGEPFTDWKTKDMWIAEVGRDEKFINYEMFGKMKAGNSDWEATSLLLRNIIRDAPEDATADTFLASIDDLELTCEKIVIADGLSVARTPAVGLGGTMRVHDAGPLTDEEKLAVSQTMFEIAKRHRMFDARDGVDLFIVGGGPVGLVTAVNAHLTGKSVTVWEKRPNYTLMQYLAAESSMQASLIHFRIHPEGGMCLSDFQKAVARLAVMLGVDLKFNTEVVALCTSETTAATAVGLLRNKRTNWVAASAKSSASLVDKYCKPLHKIEVADGETVVHSGPIRAVLGADGAGGSAVKTLMDAQSEFANKLDTTTFVNVPKHTVTRSNPVTLSSRVNGLCLLYFMKSFDANGDNSGCPGSATQQMKYKLDSQHRFGDLTETNQRTIKYLSSYVSHVNWRGKGKQQCWVELFFNSQGERKLVEKYGYLISAWHNSEEEVMKWMISAGHRVYLAVKAASDGDLDSIPKEDLSFLDFAAKKEVQSRYATYRNNKPNLLKIFESPHAIGARLLASGNAKDDAASRLGVDLDTDEMPVDLSVFDEVLQQPGFGFMKAYSIFRQEFRVSTIRAATLGRTPVAVVGDALRDPFFVFGNGLNSAIDHAALVAANLAPQKVDTLQTMSGVFGSAYQAEASAYFLLQARCGLRASEMQPDYRGHSILAEPITNPSKRLLVSAMPTPWSEGIEVSGRESKAIWSVHMNLEVCMFDAVALYKGSLKEGNRASANSALDAEKTTHNFEKYNKAFWKSFNKAATDTTWWLEERCFCLIRLFRRCDAAGFHNKTEMFITLDTLREAGCDKVPRVWDRFVKEEKEHHNRDIAKF